MPAIALTEAQKRAALAMGRAQWSDAFKRQYPKATREAKLESWKQSRKEYYRLGLLSIRRLIKDGYQIVGEGKPRKRKAQA